MLVICLSIISGISDAWIYYCLVAMLLNSASLYLRCIVWFLTLPINTGTVLSLLPALKLSPLAVINYGHTHSILPYRAKI